MLFQDIGVVDGNEILDEGLPWHVLVLLDLLLEALVDDILVDWIGLWFGALDVAAFRDNLVAVLTADLDRELLAVAAVVGLSRLHWIAIGF
jgi:hypothetical protein